MDVQSARAMLHTLMNYHGLLDQGWQYGFNQRKRGFGVCKYRYKLIELSECLVAINEEAQVRDTILHEIAHAKAGLAAGHGRLWKVTALAIGAKPEPCKDARDVAMPRGKWEAICLQCKHVHNKYRKPKPGKRAACAYCCQKYALGRFDQRFELHFHCTELERMVPNETVLLSPNR